MLAPLLVLALAVIGLVALGHWGDPVLAGIGGLVLLAGLVQAGWEARHVTPPPAEGHELAPAAEPELWAAVGEAAHIAGAPRPDRLVVAADTEAAVAVLDQGTTLVIGYPLLAAYDRSELRALLLHEMAHAATTTPTRADMARERLGLVADDARGPAALLLVPVLFAVDAIAALLGARHEEAGDRLAVRHAGREATASALRRLPAIELAWTLVLEHAAVFPAAGARASLAALLPAAIDFVRADPEAGPILAEIAGDDGGLGDPHGSLEQRIAAVNSYADDQAIPRDTRPAIGLLIDPDAVEAGVAPAGLRQLPLASWDTVVQANTVTLAADARGLVSFLHKDGCLDQATARALWEFVASDPSGLPRRLADDSRAEAVDALHQVAQVLAAQQLPLSWQVSWPVDQLVDASGRVVLARPRTDDLPTAAQALRSELEALGVRLDVEPGAGVPEPPAMSLAAMSALKASGGAHVDLVVCSTGLALVPTTGGLGTVVDASQSNHAQAERITALLDLTVDELRARAGVRWIERSAVTAWRVDPSGVLHLRHDGTSTRLRSTHRSAGHEEAIPALATTLGPGSGWWAWHRGEKG